MLWSCRRRTPAAKLTLRTGHVSTKISCDATEFTTRLDLDDALLKSWLPQESPAARDLARSKNKLTNRRENATMWTWRSSSRPLLSW